MESANTIHCISTMVLAIGIIFCIIQFRPGNCLLRSESEISDMLSIPEVSDNNIDTKEEVEIFDSENENLTTQFSDFKLLNLDCKVPPFVCPNEYITFWLSTSLDSDDVELTLQKENGIDLSKANANSPWKLIIHGFTKSRFAIPNPELKKAYYEKGSHNLLLVDYEPIARKPCYLSSVKNVPLIALCTANMIDALVEKGAFKLKDFHVIGFSLGAQIAGRLHEFMKSGKPGRITALDPAGPLFDGFLNPVVTQASGDFVDIIHTDIFLKGKPEPLGHVDFYPNGGFFQPGCLAEQKIRFSGCNHDRAPFYFAESIITKVGFYGECCPSYAKYLLGMCRGSNNSLIMGEYTPKTARGIYFLQTKSHPPYALGKAMDSADK